MPNVSGDVHQPIGAKSRDPNATVVNGGFRAPRSCNGFLPEDYW
jgi:hypothetical protein